jgi:hypothetical protein
MDARVQTKRLVLLHNHPHLQKLYELIDIMYQMEIEFAPNQVKIEGRVYDLFDCDTPEYVIKEFPPQFDFTLNYLKEVP